jgi:hypothetical protein
VLSLVERLKKAPAAQQIAGKAQDPFIEGAAEQVLSCAGWWSGDMPRTRPVASSSRASSMARSRSRGRYPIARRLANPPT